MARLLCNVLMISLLILGGCSTTKIQPEPDVDDPRNVSHEDSVDGMLNWIESADPRVEAKKLIDTKRVGVLCFKGQESACPGGVAGITKAMLVEKQIPPILIWGLDRPIEDPVKRERVIEYMAEFNTHLLEMVFESELNNK